MKPYKAKSLKAAERAVRSLTKQRAERDELLNIFDRERKMLAKLAAETPQFFNPLDVMEAKKIRDLILKQLNASNSATGDRDASPAKADAEKPDDVLADLERKHGCAAPTGSSATCDWHVSAEHKCGETAEWEMLNEEWREQVPVCSAHADQARSDGFQVRKR